MNLSPRWLKKTISAALAGILAAGTVPAAGQEPTASTKESQFRFLPQANNRLALSLLKQFCNANPHENHFFSAFSIESAVGIALEGAREETAAQMGQALGLSPDLQQSGSVPWKLELYRQEYASLSRNLQPLESSETQAVRAKLKGLKAELESVKAQSERLLREGQFAAAAKLSRQAEDQSTRFNQLAQSIDQYQLDTANSLWVDQTFPLSQAYQQIIEQFYGSAAAFACNFVEQAEQERVRINNWVEGHTQHKIMDLLAKGSLDSDTRLVIANAIYFKGNWATPFDAALTSEAPFTTSQGRSVRRRMMNAPKTKGCRYAAFDAQGKLFTAPDIIRADTRPSQLYPGPGGFQLLDIPYAGDDVSMLVILPQSTDGVSRLVSQLDQQRLSACLAALRPQKVSIEVPLFKLETKYDLVPPLKQLGMTNAFDWQRANFDGLLEQPTENNRLFISHIVHKAFVEVNEKGTEAAAATGVVMALAAAVAVEPFIPVVKADHPFVVAILHRPSQTLLFTGIVNDPVSP